MRIEDTEEFKAFKKALEKVMTLDSWYVSHFAPSKSQSEYNRDDGRYHYFELSDSKILEIAIDRLIDNEDYLSEFIQEEMPDELAKLLSRIVKLAR